MLDGIKKMLGLDPNDRALKQYWSVVEQVNVFTPEMESMKDEELRARGTQLKARASGGEEISALLPEVFALVREASWRTIGLRHYDVQLIGGMALHDGRIAEMRTGEGKTLVATLAVVLNALAGQGVHLITVNDYLAKRDAAWMAPIYNFLGLSVGVIYPYMPMEERRDAYCADITYGTNSEFGFDYLRDNMVMQKDQMVQRSHSFCIVDEVDSILIDEARTPLIISGPSDDNVDLYLRADGAARQLKEGADYETDEKERNIAITEAGIQKCETLMKIPNLFSDAAKSELAHRIVQALKAHRLFQRDVDYVVNNGEIVIVDEFTGRLMLGRRYSDGLHQAIEAKERVRVGRESQTLATITLQNYFRMYSKLAGMTGTAVTESEEFREIYGLQVVTIPTHKKMIRIDNADVIYGTVLEKFNAVADEVQERNSRGQPVLVGTTSIENSERVSKLLKARKVPHRVLNAKHHEKEAHIIAQAGHLGAVTVATNMAGRGTDIMLGGNPEFLAKEKLLAERPAIDWKIKALEQDDVYNYFVQYTNVLPEDLTRNYLRDRRLTGSNSKEAAGPYSEFLQEAFSRIKSAYEAGLRLFRVQCQEEHDKVVALGGLTIIGTERHEARRIDNQLRGRAGRQGDPGESRFYLSLEDDLLRLFGSERIQSLMGKLGMVDGEAIESSMLTKVIESSQHKVEQMHFDIRKQLLAYDNVMNHQREAVYIERHTILQEEDIVAYGWGIIQGVFEEILDRYFPEEGEPDPERAASRVRAIFGPGSEEIVARLDSRAGMEALRDEIVEAVEKRYTQKILDFTPDVAQGLLRYVVLNTLDDAWRNHLLGMDELRRGIGLRAIGQKDPLLEYQFESYNLFQEMMTQVRESFTEQFFRVRVISEDGKRRERKVSEGRNLSVSFQPRPGAEDDPRLGEPRSQAGEGKLEPIKKTVRIGRNDPCPCGSGKKYKHCCGRNI
ncbi:MAG: preprotein translocase subunit SecA [Synergistaceae bacterium]|jgi:preprotein translocase subunit SecA|nr:preprotein translocase subunit SecA [Synergistaceae bacterium]